MRIKIGDFIREIIEKTVINDQYPTLTSSQRGIMEQSAYFNKKVASKNNVGYKIIRRGQFTYRAMSDTGRFYVNQLECLDTGIVSPAYPVFEVISNDVILSEYLKFFFCSDFFQKLIELQSTGSTRVSLKLNRIKDITIDVPSLKTQRKVVCTVKKLSELNTNLEKQIDYLEQMVKSRFVEMFGDPRTNPNGYETQELRSSCTVITGNTPSRSVEEYYGDSIEWIKTDNIVSERTYPTKAAEFLSEEGAKVGRIVDENAILMACIAGSVASIGRVSITDRKVAFNQQINAVVPKIYDVRFLYVMLQISKDYLVEEINMALKGILSKSKLEDKVFYVPPMELQKQFATFAAQVDKSKLEVQNELEKLEILKKSLMQQYFG